MKAPSNLYWNKNKTVLVPEGDPDGRFYAFAVGEEISEDLAAKMKGKPEDKAVRRPAVKAAGKEE